MPITPKQRERRQRYLGASDTPRILGVSPWGSALDVYYEKTQPVSDDEPTEAMQTGNRLEGSILDWAAEQLGVRLRRNQFRAHGVLAAHCDALVVGRPEGMEAKYVGPQGVEEWGEPGTDQVPTYVAAQVQHQMFVAELDLVWVPVFMARFRPAWELYCVRRDQAIIDAIVDADMRFWQEHVLARRAPEGVIASIELLKRLRREPGSVIDLDGSSVALVAAWEEAKANAAEAGKEAERLKAAVIAALGEAEAGRLPDGRLVTYLPIHRRGYEVQATTYRALAIKKETA